jgi:hypothetical protein
MTSQAERAAAYRQTFRDFPGLPDPLCAEIRPLDQIGIRLHYATLPDVVKVAERFDTNIEFLERTAFVRVSTVYIACGEAMMAWTQLHSVEAFTLLRDWDVPVEFDMTKRICPDVIKVPAAHAASMMKVG